MFYVTWYRTAFRMETKKIGKRWLDLLVDPHIFALIYLPALLLRSVYLLQDYADVICKACFVWGCLILVYDVFLGKRNTFRSYRWYLLLAFMIVLGISVLLNFRYSLYDGIKNIVYCLLYFFVLYSQQQDISKERLFRTLKRCNYVLIVLTALAGTVSLLTFIFNINFIYETSVGIYRIGFWFNRLYGVWNPNTGSMLGLVSVVLCGLNYYLSDRKPGRWWILYIYNFVIQFIYFALSNSRAAKGCGALVLIVVLMFITYPYLRARKKLWHSLLLTTVCGLLVVGAAVGLTTGTQTVMKEVPKLTAGFSDKINPPQKPTPPDGETDKNNDIDFDRVENFDNDVDVTNNRMGMWTAAWKVVLQHPVFGVASSNCLTDDGSLKGNIDASVFTEEDLESLRRADFYFHNGYIQILLVSGFAGFAVFIVLMVCVAFRYLVYLFKSPKDGVTYKAVALIVSLLAVVVADNLVEVHFLFGGSDALAAIFWYLAGAGLLLIKLSHTSPAETILKEKQDDVEYA